MIICDKCKNEITDGRYERLPYNDKNVLCKGCYNKWVKFEIDELAKLGQEFLKGNN